MDTLVTLQKCVITSGSRSETVTTYQDFAEVWAQVERNIDEYVGNDNLEQNESYTLTIYKVSELTTRWRVVIGSSTYEIRAIDPIDRMSPFCNLTVYSIK